MAKEQLKKVQKEMREKGELELALVVASSKSSDRGSREERMIAIFGNLRRVERSGRGTGVAGA